MRVEGTEIGSVTVIVKSISILILRVILVCLVFDDARCCHCT